MLHDKLVLKDHAVVAGPAYRLSGAAQTGMELGSRRSGRNRVVQGQPSQQLPNSSAACVALPVLTVCVLCLRMTRSWMTRSGC